MTARTFPLSELMTLAGLARDLRGYFKETLEPEACRRRAVQGLETREAAFLHALDAAVWGVPESPYRWLLEGAGVEPGDVARSVREAGVEGTLERLHGEGVYVRLDEFKGRRPMERHGRVREATSRDFDNPLTTSHLSSSTGGSRSRGTRIAIDLDHYARDAVYDGLFLQAFGLGDRPWAAWRPLPPYGAGLKSMMSHARLRHPGRWFAQNRLRLRSRAWKHAVVMGLIVRAGRRAGVPLPRAEHVPLDEAGRVAEWLHARRAEGTPGWLNTNAAAGVRVAMAARERDLDLGGTLFRLGGEPLTPAKAEVMEAVGVRAVCHYSMGEAGRIGLACAAADELDEVHLLTDKVGVIQADRELSSGDRVPVNVYTTLLPTTPKLMLNVESDDHGVLRRRRCGCLLDEVGYDLHLHRIRSWEKLTSEGMNFIGADLVRLVEEVLPGTFGGHPTDYQLVEEEEGGLPRVSLLVSPRVGRVDGAAVAEVALRFLDGAPGRASRYGDRWREGGTLRVRREEPRATTASKVLALHVDRPRGERS